MNWVHQKLHLIMAIKHKLCTVKWYHTHVVACNFTNSPKMLQKFRLLVGRYLPTSISTHQPRTAVKILQPNTCKLSNHWSWIVIKRLSYNYYCLLCQFSASWQYVPSSDSAQDVDFPHVVVYMAIIWAFTGYYISLFYIFIDWTCRTLVWYRKTRLCKLAHRPRPWTYRRC